MATTAGLPLKDPFRLSPFEMRRAMRNFKLALFKSNQQLKDFKYCNGDGVRLPSASSGHSYQHIQKKKKRT